MNAIELFDRIGFGAEHSVSRPSDASIDRQLRRIIERANAAGGDCIISGRTGYYRPLQDRPAEAYELRRYLASELHRAKAILYKRKNMLAVSAEWRETECQRKTAGEKELPAKGNSPESCANMVICVEEGSNIPGQMVMRML